MPTVPTIPPTTTTAGTRLPTKPTTPIFFFCSQRNPFHFGVTKYLARPQKLGSARLYAPATHAWWGSSRGVSDGARLDLDERMRMDQVYLFFSFLIRYGMVDSCRQRSDVPTFRLMILLPACEKSKTTDCRAGYVTKSHLCSCFTEDGPALAFYQFMCLDYVMIEAIILSLVDSAFPSWTYRSREHQRDCDGIVMAVISNPKGA